MLNNPECLLYNWKLLFSKGRLGVSLGNHHGPSEWGQTPLHVAALYSQLETAHLLLDSGANAKAIDAQGRQRQSGCGRRFGSNFQSSTEITNHYN